jgi:hypothetical protein
VGGLGGEKGEQQLCVLNKGAKDAKEPRCVCERERERKIGVWYNPGWEKWGTRSRSGGGGDGGVETTGVGLFV